MDTNLRRRKRATTFRIAGWLAVASMVAVALVGPSTTLAVPSGDGTWAKSLPSGCAQDTTGTMLWVWNGDGSPGALTINGHSQGDGWTQQGAGAWHFTVTIASGSNYVPTLASVAAATGNLELSHCNNGGTTTTTGSSTTTTTTAPTTTTTTGSSTTTTTTAPTTTSETTQAFSSSVEATTATSAGQTGAVLAATSKPHVAPPPTSTLPTSGTPGTDTWRLVLLGLAALVASLLLLSPSATSTERRR